MCKLFIHATFACLTALLVLSPALAADAPAQVQVVDPYIELHTGPGRGYPVFHALEQGEWLNILKRRTDWFKVATQRGTTGWVSREQLTQTLDSAGVLRSFRDVLRDDFLARRLEFGFSGGEFGGDPALGVRLAWRATDNVLIETYLTQASGSFSSSRIYGANLSIQPFATSRISPYFSVGLGNFSNEPKAVLVDTEKTSSELASVGAGLRGYLTRRFMLRASYSNHLALVKTEDYEEFDEWSVGFSFFF